MLHETSATIGAPQARASWWQRPYRMVQTNLRQIDGDLDPVRLARQVRAFGADVLVFNIGGIYAFYPTELELQAPNPYLKGDLLADMIRAAHAEDVAVVGRLDLSKSTQKAYDAHPEWFVHNAAGKPLEYNGTYQACVNGGWYQDYGMRIIREAIGRYAVDGVFFNMFGYRTTDYSGNYHGICVCDACRLRFRNMYGRELPARESFDDPAYRDYLAFQEATTADLSQKAYDTIKATRPSVAVTGHRHAADLIRLEVQRAVDRPQPEWPYQAGEQAKWGAMIGLGKTYASTSTNFVDFAWRYAAETGPYHMLRFAQQLAGGAALDYYLLGTFDQDDVKPFGHIERLYHWHGKNEAAYTGLTSAARVALYHSRKSDVHRGATQTGATARNGFRGAYRALVEDRIPFDFISDDHADTPIFGELLARYDVIVLANVTCLDDAEAAALDAYVAAGGTLVVTGETGAYGPTGLKRARPALASLPITAAASDGSSWRGAYFQIGAGDLDLPHTKVLMLDGLYFEPVVKAGATTKLRLLPPQRFGPPELCFTDAVADKPGLVEGAHGAGRVVYLPWLPEVLYWRDSLPDIRAALTQPVRAGIKAATVGVTGAGPIEVTIQASRDGRRVLVHVVNYSGQRNNLYEEPAAIHGLRLGVAASGAARALVADVALTPSETVDGLTWYDLPPVGFFEAVEIVAG